MMIKHRRVVFKKQCTSFVDLSNGIKVVRAVSSKTFPTLSEDYKNHGGGISKTLTIAHAGRAASLQPGAVVHTTHEGEEANEATRKDATFHRHPRAQAESSISKEDIQRRDKVNKLLKEATNAAKEAAESNRGHTRNQASIEGKTQVKESSTRKRKEDRSEEHGRATRALTVASSVRRPKELPKDDGCTTRAAAKSKDASSPKPKASTAKGCAPKPSARAAKREALRHAAFTVHKPLFEVNDKVFAPWWPDAKRKSQPTWFPGVITHYDISGSSGKYGATRYYTVCFDEDKSESKGVVDACVFSREDYILSTSIQDGSNDKHGWIGVNNVLDEKSSDTWASTVGWYEVSIGEFSMFSHSSSFQY